MGGSCLSFRSRLTGIRKPHQTLKMFWPYSLWHLLSFMLDYQQPCTVRELAVICSLGVQSPVITGSSTARVDPARTPWASLSSWTLPSSSPVSSVSSSFLTPNLCTLSLPHPSFPGALFPSHSSSFLSLLICGLIKERRVLSNFSSD